jgi:death-on-curing family protein
MSEESKLIVYQTDDGGIALQADAEQETVWATQKQLAEVFGVNVPTINEHIKNIFKTDELEEASTIRKFRIVQQEGKREVARNIDHYNLDMMISVGYRVNSKTATKFRKWATQTLKQHITQGYTINPNRIAKNLDTFLHAVEEVKALAQDNQQLQTDDVLALVTAFAHTWFSLEAYDEDNLPTQGSSRSSIQLEASELYRAVDTLKQTLITQGQATPLFAQEKNEGSLQGIVGNIYQSAFGEDVYPTLEEKAANLFYFIIKNHPFNDGNKRTAAFAFIWFLQKSGVDFKGRVTPEALTSITLLIAESNPTSKARMIGLVILLLTGKTSYV